MIRLILSVAMPITSVVLSTIAISQVQQVPRIRTLTEQELIDMMVGASIQASRSSNSPAMIKQIKDALAAGKTFKIVSMNDVPDDWYTVVPSGVGGGGAW